MTKSLIIAEKPSVAQDIVRALTPVAGKFEKHPDHFENERYVVTSAVGHLVEIQAPEDAEAHRYVTLPGPDWARRWPSEDIWVARRNG